MSFNIHELNLSPNTTYFRGQQTTNRKNLSLKTQSNKEKATWRKCIYGTSGSWSLWVIMNSIPTESIYQKIYNETANPWLMFPFSTEDIWYFLVFSSVLVLWFCSGSIHLHVISLHFLARARKESIQLLFSCKPLRQLQMVVMLLSSLRFGAVATRCR